MTKITAFDSKEFKRSNKAKEVKFYTPLGCGITVSKQEDFCAVYAEKLRELLTSFGVKEICGAFSSSEYIKQIGPAKTYRLSDELVKSVQDLIESVYFSYVILPSNKIPTVEVGGYKSPKIPIGTFDFLRKLSVYFSYVTAWNYIGIEDRLDEKILIDGFQGKLTPAWDDIIKRTTPEIYSHGDECNPFISIADVIAFLTDKKLWDNYLKLTPENITEVWKNYSFEIDVHYLDPSVISKIKWYTNEHIQLSPYYARPIVYLKADGYNIMNLKKISVYQKATIFARQLNGCVQGFDKAMDSYKIKDGDIFVYAGEESKKMALTLSDMFKIEVLAFRDLEEKINTA